MHQTLTPVARRLLLGRIELLALGGLLLAVAGCRSSETLSRERRVEYQHEAGSAHFAVLSVAPWEEYAESMQPHFPFSELDALQEVVPDTQAFQETVTRLLQAGGGATTSSLGEGETAPEVGSGPTAILPGQDVSTHHIPSVLQTRIGIDSMLKYWAATALYQEVQLLNRYVRDAALREGFDPYVVRLQISLLPSARNEPYDAYSTLSFFTRSGGGDDDPLVAQADAGTPLFPLRGEGGGVGSKGAAWETPHVLPFLVTDNLEASLQSRMMDNVRQLAGALSALGSAASVELQMQQVERDVQSVHGRDLNSLMTVARLSDNTLKVRLGAMLQAQATYAMVPRTHNITLLVMVPRGAPRRIQVISRTNLVDARSGEPLPHRPVAVIDRELDAIRARHGLEGVDREELDVLLACAQRNDQRAYFFALGEVLGEEGADFPYPRTLWVDLVSLLGGSQYGSTEFDLPRPDGEELEGSLFPPPQVALIRDDGSSRAEAVLRGVEVLDSSGWSATLVVYQGARVLPLLSEDLIIDGAMQEMRISFPSLTAWGLTEAASSVGNLVLELRHQDEWVRYEALYSRPGP